MTRLGNIVQNLHRLCKSNVKLDHCADLCYKFGSFDIKDQDMQLPIHSIFCSTEGEGIHIGTPQIFVRFQGCAVGCINCDSKETWDFKEGSMTLDEVLAQIEDIRGTGIVKISRVSITGGDPLHPKNTPFTLLLAKRLKTSGFFVNIEAAGTRVVDELFDIVDFVSFDIKTPSTGVNINKKLLLRFLDHYPDKAQVKAVIANKKDFSFLFDLYQETFPKIGHNIHIPWVLTPSYEPGEEFPQRRFGEIMRMNEAFGGPFRVIGQQHKWVHGPDQRNV